MEQHEQDAERTEALRNLLANSNNSAAPPPSGGTSRQRQRTLVLMVLLGWTIIGWIWSTRPGMIFGTTAEEPASAEVREASLRYAMYLQAADIAAFEADSNRLPNSLTELESGPAEGVSWAVNADDGWMLTGQDGEIRLQLAERANADSFLGNSLTILQRQR